MQAFIIASSLLAVLLFAALAAAITGYAYIASQLPSPDELVDKADKQFVSSQIYDRAGNLLYELIDPHGGRREKVPLDRISRYVILATIDTEDAYFYRHPGFDPLGLVRVLYYAFTEQEFVSGGSTITQQVARNLVLSEEERTERTLRRKIREIVLASEISRRYSKDRILEIYLNGVNYGNLAYGIQAAAQTYFGKSAADLNLAEASFLAGLPQSPATYDVFGTGYQAALRRQHSVLALMVEQGDINQAQADAAAAEMAAYEFKLPETYTTTPAPHFVAYVRSVIEEQYGTQVYHTSLKLYTTLDPRLQRIAEQVAREQIGSPELEGKHVTNAAVLVLDAHTSEILAMVGSVDFYNADIQGQVNMATAPRQPGSSIKPLTYVTAFEKGWTPSTLIWDVPVRFVNQYGQEYKPLNYDRRFHGPVTVRTALANSYNVPAVKALDYVGLPAFLDKARQAGITTLTRPDYWLALTLGGGEVSLVEMAGLYQAFANGGRRVPPAAIQRVLRSDGEVVFEYQPPEGEPLFSPQHAYLITSILSDNAARTPAFGANSWLKLSRPAAAKTGTTDDFRDNWTLGYTPDMVVGVWVGNADNSPMQGTTGLSGAAPIWHAFIEKALEGQPPKDFERPAGILEKEICTDTGTQPSIYCPADRRGKEVFAEGQLPPGPEADLHWPPCGGAGGSLVFVYPNDEFVKAWVASPAGQAWAQARGCAWVAEGQCGGGGAPSSPLYVSISQPAEGSLVAGLVQVVGTVSGPLHHYEAMYEGREGGWISGPHFSPVENNLVTVWDVSGLPAGEYTLRIIAYATSGETTEARVKVFVGP